MSTEPPVVVGAFRARRLAWFAVRLAVIAAVVWAAMYPDLLDDPEGVVIAWWTGALFGGLALVLATLRWVRPVVYACPSCGDAAPGGAGAAVDLDALWAKSPRVGRRALATAGGFVALGHSLIAWLFDGLSRPAIACPSCHAWFVRPVDA